MNSFRMCGVTAQLVEHRTGVAEVDRGNVTLHIGAIYILGRFTYRGELEHDTCTQLPSRHANKIITLCIKWRDSAAFVIMIYAVDGSFVQNHEGKLKHCETFTDCRVKIVRQRASPIRLKITEMSLYFFVFKQSRDHERTHT